MHAKKMISLHCLILVEIFNKCIHLPTIASNWADQEVKKIHATNIELSKFTNRFFQSKDFTKRKRIFDKYVLTHYVIDYDRAANENIVR